MKRPKFVRVVTVPLPRASTHIEGVRKVDDVLQVNQVVPVAWFADTPDSIFAHLMNPSSAGGLGVLVEHQPDVKEMEVLRHFYPGAFDATPASSEARTGLDKTDSPVQALTPDPSPSGRGEAKTRNKKQEEDGE